MTDERGTKADVAVGADMARTTIYVQAWVLELAKAQKLNVSKIARVAIKTAVLSEGPDTTDQRIKELEAELASLKAERVLDAREHWELNTLLGKLGARFDRMAVCPCQALRSMWASDAFRADYPALRALDVEALHDRLRVAAADMEA